MTTAAKVTLCVIASLVVLLAIMTWIASSGTVGQPHGGPIQTVTR